MEETPIPLPHPAAWDSFIRAVHNPRFSNEFIGAHARTGFGVRSMEEQQELDDHVR